VIICAVAYAPTRKMKLDATHDDAQFKECPSPEDSEELGCQTGEK